MKGLMIVALALTALASSAPFSCADEKQAAVTLPRDKNVLAVGTKAPNFTRFTAAGKKLSLKDYRGRCPVVLYFYPKDETPNCIKEACGFRDFTNSMKRMNAEVIGVSGDSEEAHQSFTLHYALPFDLISDSDNSLLRLYHVPFFKDSLHRRVTFIIDKDGTIANVIQYTNDGDVHVREALKAISLLNTREKI